MNYSAEQKKIKVLFLARWYPNETNIQLGVFIQKHAAAASKYCDVALLNIVSHDQLKEKFKISYCENNGIKAVIVYHRKIKSRFFPFNKISAFTRYLSAHRRGMKLIKEKFGKHEITHAYIFIRPVVLAWLMKIFNGKPFVISEQWSGYVSGKFERKNLIEKLLVKYLAAKASAVTTVSNFLRKGMIHNGIKGNFHVIPNVIETDSKPSPKKRSDGRIKILSVADLVDEIKNISGTIKAVAEITKIYSQIRFDIVGGGHDRVKLEQLAEELSVLNKNVFFHGMKTNEEVYQYLHQCDFLIMNSRFETFSSICAEAMSCGKPVIATRCGGPDEFVTPLTGTLVAPDNQEQLIAALKNMMENYSSYDSRQIKKYATEKFNADVIGKQFLEIYTSILS
jgi:glycosyltransferase involved in cell wall biosynthesis